MNLSAPATLPQALAGALRRLAQLAHTSSWDQWALRRLSPTQRKILELLGRHASLSLSGVARELGVTAATACDSVSALESKGLLHKQRNAVDARSVSLTLSCEGRLCLETLAARPDPLCGAFAALAEEEQEQLYRLSIKMLRTLQEVGTLPRSRMCVGCRFFDPYREPQTASPHYCQMLDSALAERQLRIDCSEFVAAEGTERADRWARFLARGRTSVSTRGADSTSVSS